MSTINPVKQKNSYAEKAHLNHMGGLSYDISNPVKQLEIVASSCFFGEPTYYDQDAKPVSNSAKDYSESYLDRVLGAFLSSELVGYNSKNMLEKAIDLALNHSIEDTLKLAAKLRTVDYIRVTPQVILVRAANHPKGRGSKAPMKGTRPAPSLVVRYGPSIVQRGDEPALGLAYQLATYKDKAIPNSLKKVWNNVISNYNEYTLAKYNQKEHNVNLFDVVNLVHPKSEAVSKFMKGELSNKDATWEAIVSEGKSSKESWEKSLEVMGHMALLRNLRNLIEKGVEPKLYVDKLIDGAKTGKQLPFRYYSAYNAIKEVVGVTPSVLDAVETSLEDSLKNLPKLNGKVMSLCDNSGSAQGATTSSMGSMQVSTIGNLTGVLTGKVSDEGYLGVFGDKLEVFPIRKKESVFAQVEKAEKLGDGIGQGTENGIWLFWDKAIKENQHWDHVFVYSDMQAGHGGLYGTNVGSYKDFIFPNSHNKIDVPKLIAEYRKKVNPNVMVYLVQIAGYKDTIIPEYFNRTYILGGWGDGMIKFAGKMQELMK